MAADVKNFYLNTPLYRPEYMRISVKTIPEKVMEYYQGEMFLEDGYIYFEINKGMYGLPKASSLENKLLQKRPAGLRRNETVPIQFALVVD